MNENNELYNKLTTFIQEISGKQTADIKKHIREEVEVIKETLNEEIAKRTELEKELQELKSKYKVLEKELRKNSIVIFNFDYKGENNILDFTIDKLNQLLEINITKEYVNNIYEIGKNKESNRPIIVKFTSYIIKQIILKNWKKLKGTNISIAEELSLDERKTQNILRQHLKKARAKNLNAYIKGEQLYINGEVYKAEELTENDEDGRNEHNVSNVAELRKSNSAPPTPKTKILEEINQEEEINGPKEKEEDKGNTAKKRKFSVVNSNLLPGRSSSRLIEKEVKQATNSKNIN